LKFLSNANATFLEEMKRLNDRADLEAHANMGGAIFKRKSVSTQRLSGLGSFLLAGYAYKQ